MTKLLSYQEAVKDELLRHDRNILFSPPGCGMDTVVAASLKEMVGTKLIVDAAALGSEWRRILDTHEITADVVSPEKMSMDHRSGIEYTYNNVVWNVSSRGKSILEAMRLTANNADRVIIRRLEYSMERNKLLSGFAGPFNVVHLVASDDGIYPLLNKKFDSAGLLKRLGL